MCDNNKCDAISDEMWNKFKNEKLIPIIDNLKTTIDNLKTTIDKEKIIINNIKCEFKSFWQLFPDEYIEKPTQINNVNKINSVYDAITLFMKNLSVFDLIITYPVQKRIEIGEKIIILLQLFCDECDDVDDEDIIDVLKNLTNAIKTA